MKINKMLLNYRIIGIIIFVFGFIAYAVYSTDLYKKFVKGQYAGYWSIEECYDNVRPTAICDEAAYPLKTRLESVPADEVKAQILGVYPEPDENFKLQTSLRNEDLKDLLNQLTIGQSKADFLNKFTKYGVKDLENEDMAFEIGKGFKIKASFQYNIDGTDIEVSGEFNDNNTLSRIFILGLNDNTDKDITSALGRPEYIYKNSPTILAFQEYVYSSKGVTIMRTSGGKIDYLILYKPVKFEDYKAHYRDTFIRGWYK